MNDQRPPRPSPPTIYGAIVMTRDGINYQVSVDGRSGDGTVSVVGHAVSDVYETHWPDRIEHPWMWGKPLGTVVEMAVDRTHRRHLRKMARQRDTEELKRQLATREAARRERE